MADTKQVKQIKQLLRKSVNQMRSVRTMNEIGKQTRDIIVKRTRLGFGVPANGASRQRLKPLSDSYIKQRAGELAFFTRNGVVIPFKPIQAPRLSRRTTPRKSNLTFTNQMLDSIKQFVTRLGEVDIRPTGTRRDGLTNEEVATFVSKERPFMHLSNNEIKQVTIVANDLFTEIIRKNLTTLK